MIAFAVSALAAAVGWITWTSTKARLSYDLHKIPGPPAWPLVGNLGGILGSSYMHKVFAACLPPPQRRAGLILVYVAIYGPDARVARSIV